jgi:hypothetical protein
MTVDSSRASARSTATGRFGSDPAFLLALATFLLTIRVPKAIFLMGIVGLALLMRRRRLRGGAWVVVVSYAVCTLAALIANVAFGLGLDPTSNAWTALSLGLFTAAVVGTGDRLANAVGVVKGLMAGFTFALVMALTELATGWRLVAQGANREAAAALAENPLRTAAFYANYNDLSIALAIFSLLLVGWILFQPRTGPWSTVARLAGASVASALVLVMGSRGALLALGAGLALLVFLAARAHRPQTVTFPRMGVVLLALSPAMLWVWHSPYFQDSSTGIRERILHDAETLMGPVAWTVGFGSTRNYAELAEAAFPYTLMDPHNLILEFVLRYGLVGLTVVCAVWVFVVVEGLSARQPRHWMVPTLTALVATIPILGVVPSTILPYGFVQLTIAALAAVLAHERQVGLSVRPAPTLAVDQPTNRATQKL